MPASSAAARLMPDATTWRGVPALLLVSALALAGCSGHPAGTPTAPDPPDPPPPPLSITSSSLPNGQVDHAYTATLTATGGQAPLHWVNSSGTLPAGLTLAASTGAISGTPTAAVTGAALTFTVTDSSTTAQTKSITLTLNVSPAVITLAITPARAAVAVTQPLTLAATTNDSAGVSWGSSPAGGAFSQAGSASGAPVTLTVASAGVYTVTATSVTDGTRSAAITIGVTDLAGVFTYHNDLARDAVNAQEYALTPKSVNTASFGKLFSCAVDGAVLAQPLWVANLTVGGTRHNVVFVATGQDSLYAFDADASPCLQLWHVSLIDAAHGGTAGEVTNSGYGIVGTPVIDPTANILYAVSRSLNSAGTSTYQRLQVIDALTGSEKTGSPVTIQASFPYAGGQRIFDARNVNARAGLALVRGTIYVTFGALTEPGTWFGWMMGYTYDGSALTQTAVFNVAPNGNGGGVWMSGSAPAADAQGNLYVTTGNGTFDADTSSLAQRDYGDSFLQLNGALGVKSYFAPSNQHSDDINDWDFGAGGATLALSLNTGPVQHVVVGGGKDGALYVLNGDTMGGLGDNNALQRLPLTGGPVSNDHFGGIFSGSAFWNNTLYIGPAGVRLQAYAFDTGKVQLGTAPTSQSPNVFNWPGAGLAISAPGNGGSAVVWAIDSSSSCTGQACGPAVLHAYSGANLAIELWNSSIVSTDAAGYAVKFTVPTVANGKVYIGTRSKDTGNPGGNSSITGELDVYGLKPN